MAPARWPRLQVGQAILAVCAAGAKATRWRSGPAAAARCGRGCCAASTLPPQLCPMAGGAATGSAGQFVCRHKDLQRGDAGMPRGFVFSASRPAACARESRAGGEEVALCVCVFVWCFCLSHSVSHSLAHICGLGLAWLGKTKQTKCLCRASACVEVTHSRPTRACHAAPPRMPAPPNLQLPQPRTGTATPKRAHRHRTHRYRRAARP